MTNIGKGKFSEDVDIKNKSQTVKKVKMSVQDEKTLENTAKQQTDDNE